MAKKFSELREKMSPAHQSRARARTQELLGELPLQELRHAREMSQEKLGKLLGANQASVSKIEHRTDMYVSTLREYIKAMGGELDIVARFPDGSVKINQFQDLESSGGTAPKRITR